MIFTAIGIIAFLAITVRFAFRQNQVMHGEIQHRKSYRMP
jgi:hypothetical protein